MRKLLGVIVLSILSGFFAAGQGRLPAIDGAFLEKLQERDSVLIGDQLRYGFHLQGVPVGTGLLLPDYSKGFAPGDSVEIVHTWTADTVKVNGSKRHPTSHDIDFSLVITSFEEGKHRLPPLSVIKESSAGVFDTLLFKPLELEVFTIPVDTTTYVIHDIKGQVQYPVTFSEVLPYLIGLLVALALAWAIRALVVARRKRRSPDAAPDEPPYLVALRKLEKDRGEKYWAKDRQKVF